MLTEATFDVWQKIVEVSGEGLTYYFVECSLCILEEIPFFFSNISWMNSDTVCLGFFPGKCH